MSDLISNNEIESRPTVVLDVKTQREVTAKDLEDINSFRDFQIEVAVKDFDIKSKESNERMEKAYVHVNAAKTIRLSMKDDVPLSIIFARDGDNQLLGYSVVSFNSQAATELEKVSTTFIGVDPNYQNKGIGKMILEKRLSILKSMGIKSYITNVREDALRLYQKLGIRFESRPLEHNPKGKQLTVYLD